MLKFLGLLIQLIISPAKGWEDIAAVGSEPRKICADGFYPLLGIAACSVFIQMLYPLSASLVAYIQQAIITFAKFFISYFLSSYIFSFSLKKIVDGADPNEKKYNTFIIYNISLLALITIIANSLPMEHPIVQFLPVYVLFVMWMGGRYLVIKSGCELKFIVLSAVAILLPPAILGYLFNLILPQA
jgi:hypothetical protein